MCCFPASVQKGGTACPSYSHQLVNNKDLKWSPHLPGSLGFLQPHRQGELLLLVLFSGSQPPKIQGHKKSITVLPSAWLLAALCGILNHDWDGDFCGPRISLFTTKMMETCLCWQWGSICLLDWVLPPKAPFSNMNFQRVAHQIPPSIVHNASLENLRLVFPSWAAFLASVFGELFIHTHVRQMPPYDTQGSPEHPTSLQPCQRLHIQRLDSLRNTNWEYLS